VSWSKQKLEWKNASPTIDEATQLLILDGIHIHNYMPVPLPFLASAVGYRLPGGDLLLLRIAFPAARAVGRGCGVERAAYLPIGRERSQVQLMEMFLEFMVQDDWCATAIHPVVSASRYRTAMLAIRSCKEIAMPK
jgi:hypothetical protein